MKMLIVYYGDSPHYVEGFSPVCKRSGVGSLHLLPRRPMTITADEYEHLKVRYPQLARSVKIVSKTADDVPVEPPEPTPVAEDVPSLVAAGVEAKQGDDVAFSDEGKAKGPWLKKKAKET